jgi:hypothetical protein
MVKDVRTSGARAALFGMIASLTLFAQSTASVEGRFTNNVTGEPVSDGRQQKKDQCKQVHERRPDLNRRRSPHFN